MKKLILLIMGLCSSVAFSQALPYIPMKAGLYASATGAAGSWNPWAALGGTTIPNVPEPVAAYGSTDGTGNPGTWAPLQQPSQTTGLRTMSAYCTGLVAASTTTNSLLGLGGNNIGCPTATSFNPVGMITVGTGTLANLKVRCNVTGVNASSGAFTLHDLRAGTDTATPITVTYGTVTGGTVVSDSTHAYAYQDGDLVRIEFTTQAAETLQYCAVSFTY